MTTAKTLQLIHATCIAIDGAGVLLYGPSGVGKSDLALRLIDTGAMLVADDYCSLELRNDAIYATARKTIAGKIEVRGIGIVDMPYLHEAAVILVVNLAAEYPRMPEENAHAILLGQTIPAVTLNSFEISAVQKVRIALLSVQRKTA
jgi:serine kinase of HPr protein (carbohydrate metabolism regulator)